MHGDIERNDPRLRGNPNPEEIERICDDILRPFKAKHAAPPLTDTEAAVVKGKFIHTHIIREVRKELGDVTQNPFRPDYWRSRLMEAYRANFNTHLSREELIEILAVMHTEIAIDILR